MPESGVSGGGPTVVVILVVVFVSGEDGSHVKLSLRRYKVIL